jgi:hypothetical protein
MHDGSRVNFLRGGGAYMPIEELSQTLTLALSSFVAMTLPSPPQLFFYINQSILHDGEDYG